MGIDIEFPRYIAKNEETLLQRIQFSYSPLHEMMRSMHVLRNPKHHGIHLPWVIEAAKHLTESMKRDLNYFHLCYELGVPIRLTPGLSQTVFSMEEELSLLSKSLYKTESNQILNELIQVSEHKENKFIPSLAKGIEWEGFSFSDKKDLIEDLKTDPQEVINRFLNFLKNYWEEIFMSIWGELKDQLLDEIVSQTKELKQNGFSSFIQSTSSRIHWSHENATLHFHKPFDWNYKIKSDDAIIFVPSYFVWPHLFVDQTHKGIVVVYDSSKARKESQPEQPIDRMVLICRALGEPTRLQLLKLLQNRALTTQSLAQICHLSEGTVSRHLQVLKKADLVTFTKEKKYVLYTCKKDVFNTISNLVTEATTIL